MLENFRANVLNVMRNSHKAKVRLRTEIISIVPFNLVPRAHMSFGQHQDTP